MEEKGFMSPPLAISSSYREGGSKCMSRRRSRSSPGSDG
ncbi:unnamed protein product [Arabidopsis halleri]